MKLTFLACSILLYSVCNNAQSFSSQDPTYIESVNAGEYALNEGKYDSCLVHYALAFEIKQISPLSTLRGAACAFMVEDEVILDKYLDKAFELNWDETKAFINDYPEFKFLKNTSFEKMINARWAEAAKASGLNLALVEEFAEIRMTDQLYRKQMRVTSDKFGSQSPQMESLWNRQNRADRINIRKIVVAIDQYGYPGKSLVGPRQASTAFLVIQHAELEVQEKYLKTITDAADAGEVEWSSVALLVDRVKMRSGEKQIYGSQINQDPETEEYFFAEIENPYKIDSIRATVGLGSLQEYANNWSFKWDPDAHVKRHANKE